MFNNLVIVQNVKICDKEELLFKYQGLHNSFFEGGPDLTF